MIKALLLGALAITAGAQSLHAQESVDLSIYPQAKAAQTQHVFTLPTMENEDVYKIEVVVGQTMLADCNRIMISADLDEDDVKGWGYSYYTVEDISSPASTMMGCGDQAKSEQFVEFYFDDENLLRYNSKLPIVIYAPSELSVRYRVWQTDGELHEATAQ